MAYKFTILSFKGTGYSLASFGGDNVSFGRSPENDLVLKDNDVSRKHASIIKNNNDFFIEDFYSLNGTYLYEKDSWVKVEGQKKVNLPVMLIIGVNLVLKIEYIDEDYDSYGDTSIALDGSTSIIEPIFDKERFESIMVLDMCDSTKIANVDEELAYNMKIRLNQIAMPVICMNNLSFFKGTGDGFLATFPNTRDALNSAITLASKLTDTKKITRGFPLNFRIALHYGKIYFTDSEGTDVHGNDINITFRIEGLQNSSFLQQYINLPEENRIICTKEFYERAKKTSVKTKLTFTCCGFAKVKGIETSIEIYYLKIK